MLHELIAGKVTACAGRLGPGPDAGQARGLAEAQAGMFDDHHGEFVQLLDQIAFLDERIS